MYLEIILTPFPLQNNPNFTNVIPQARIPILSLCFFLQVHVGVSSDSVSR